MVFRMIVAMGYAGVSVRSPFPPKAQCQAIPDFDPSASRVTFRNAEELQLIFCASAQQLFEL